MIYHISSLLIHSDPHSTLPGIHRHQIHLDRHFPHRRCNQQLMVLHSFYIFQSMHRAICRKKILSIRTSRCKLRRNLILRYLYRWHNLRMWDRCSFCILNRRYLYNARNRFQTNQQHILSCPYYHVVHLWCMCHTTMVLDLYTLNEHRPCCNYHTTHKHLPSNVDCICSTLMSRG